MSKTLPLPRWLPVPIVTTWTLWRKLLVPSAHPLCRRTLRMSSDGVLFTAHMNWLVPLVGGLTGCGLWSLFFQTESTVPAFLLAATVLVSTIYVIMWATDTSVQIVRERERGTYDALCLPPSGALGVHWAICTASLHRKETFMWIDLLRKIVAGLLLFAFVWVVIIAASREKAVETVNLLALLLDMVLLAVATYLDHVQATVLGCLVGMGVPFLAKSAVGARVWTTLGFLALQCGVVVATLVSVVLAAPLLPPLISPLAFGLLMFFVIREGIVIRLWRALARRLTIDPARIDLGMK